MVPKRNNSMNITQETAAEKNKKWEQLKKKGMEQQQKEVIATICSVMRAANNPPVLEAIGLRPYKKEYDLLFEKLKDYFQEWIKDKQAMDFINDRSKEEKEKWEEEGKKTKEQKKKETEEKLKFVTKTTAELSDILLKYGSALFKAKWKINQSPDQKKSAENEICMQDFYPEFKTFTTFLENERQSEEFRSLDLLVRWIQELNSYLVLAWHIGYGKQKSLTKEEAEEGNCSSSVLDEINETDRKKVVSQSAKREKEKADLNLALTNTLNCCIVHYDPEAENANFERYYHKCAGMISTWLKQNIADELRQLNGRKQHIASAVCNALEVFEKIKYEMQDLKGDAIGSSFYMDYPEICRILAMHPYERPTAKHIQYLIKQKYKDAYNLKDIKMILEKLKSNNDRSKSIEAMNAKGEKDWTNTNFKTGTKFDNVISKREYDEFDKDAKDIKNSVLLKSHREADMMFVVITSLNFAHGLSPNEIAKKLGIAEESILKVLDIINDYR